MTVVNETLRLFLAATALILSALLTQQQADFSTEPQIAQTEVQRKANLQNHFGKKIAAVRAQK